jgi:Flp pilus assembly protein TadD
MRFSGVFALLVSAVGAAGVDTRETAAARATQQIEAGDFQSAALTVRSYLNQSSREPDLWNLLGICESELKHPDSARQAFEKGLQLEPLSPGLHENIGLLYFREGDYAAAQKHLARAISLGSNKTGVRFSLAASQVRTGEPRTGLAALIQLENDLSNLPDYWTERGWVEMRFEPVAAAVSFERALALTPNDLRALNGAASAAESQQNDEEALSFLLRAKKNNPDDLRTLLHFAAICLRRDLTVDALDALQHARQLAPANNLALFLYARAQIAFQQWQQSHDLFTEFDRRVPNYAPAQYALGWLDVKLNRPGEARRHLERSLALDSKEPDVRYELGQLDLTEGRLDDAARELEAVLAAQPRHSKANVAFGDLLLRKGDLNAAKTRYEAATEGDPKSGPAHYKLSTVLLRLHDSENAAKERSLGAALNAEAEKTSKSVLVLASPDGSLLTGDPAAKKGIE